MAGFRPANTGNRSATRFGPTVSRRLRAADVNVSPAARKHKASGIFVSAQADHISVLVDLGLSRANNRAADAILGIVLGWAEASDVDVRGLGDNDDTFVISFSYGR